MLTRTNLGMHLRKRSEIGGELEALYDVTEGRRFTYGDLDARCDRAAWALASLGLRKGDRVAMLLPNGVRYIDLYYGATRAGIIVVPINLRLVADEVSYILHDSGAKALVYGDAHAAIAADLRARTGEDAVPIEFWLSIGGAPGGNFSYDTLLEQAPAEPFEIVAHDEDPIFIMYTSGTTGRPKGTVQTHSSIEWSLLTVLGSTDMRYRDRYLISMPLYHCAAFNNVGTTLYRGGTAVLCDHFNAEETWRLLRDERIDITLAVPAMLTQLLETFRPVEHHPLSLRWILTGAQPMSVDLIKSVEAMGFAIYQGYGLTEAGGVGSVMSPEHAIDRPSSIGKAFFHTQMKVVDSTGRICDPEEAGELLIKGPHLMKEYLNQPEATAAVLVDGWLHTGDVATVDAEGFIYIRDRMRDMIISGGENVYPAEIEAVLSRHPKIVEVSVIGLPSARWGETPVAVVVGEDGLTEADVLAFCAGRLARYKQPSGVRFIEALPRNSVGKPLKRVLRELYASEPK